MALYSEVAFQESSQCLVAKTTHVHSKMKHLQENHVLETVCSRYLLTSASLFRGQPGNEAGHIRFLSGLQLSRNVPRSLWTRRFPASLSAEAPSMGNGEKTDWGNRKQKNKK